MATRLTLSQSRELISQKHGDRRTVFFSKGKPGAYTSSLKYLGQWQANKKHGKGAQTWANGDKYVGEWAAGKPSGFGTFWKQGKQGLLKQYAGEWEGGKQHGRGAFYYDDGGAYDGQWRAGLRHGVGVMSYADSSVYEGDWFNDRRHGYGILDHANGDHFEGQYVEDKREGEGVLFFFSAEKKTHHKRMDGEWVDDVCKCSIYSEMEPDPNVPASMAPEPLPKLHLLKPDSVLAAELARIREQRASHRAARVIIDEHFTEEVRAGPVTCTLHAPARIACAAAGACGPGSSRLAPASLFPHLCAMLCALPSHSRRRPRPQELVALRTAFGRVDAGECGVLSLPQLREAFAHLGMDPSDDDLDEMLADLRAGSEAPVDRDRVQFSFGDFAQACDFFSPVDE